MAEQGAQTQSGAATPRSNGSVAPSRRGVDVGVLLIAALALAIVAGALVLAARAGGETPPDYPADSPEARLRAYVEAVQAGDLPSAYGMLSEAYRREVGQVEFGDRFGYVDPSGRTRIAIAERAVAGDRATLDLDVLTVYDEAGPGYSEFERRERVTLVREGGEWRLERPPAL